MKCSNKLIQYYHFNTIKKCQVERREKGNANIADWYG